MKRVNVKLRAVKSIFMHGQRRDILDRGKCTNAASIVQNPKLSDVCRTSGASRNQPELAKPAGLMYTS